VGPGVYSCKVRLAGRGSCRSASWDSPPCTYHTQSPIRNSEIKTSNSILIHKRMGGMKYSPGDNLYFCSTGENSAIFNSLLSLERRSIKNLNLFVQ
jgi:hypothetical protein